MSTMMTRLEKLKWFGDQNREINEAAIALQNRAQDLGKQWVEYLQTDIGIDGNVHMAEIIKKAIETTIEPSRIIRP